MKRLSCISCLILFVFISNAFAESTINLLKTNLQSYLPELVISGVKPTVIPGVYEVISKHKVFYVDETGRYAILGNMVDLKTKNSITEREVRKLSAVKWSDLPLQIALRRTLGNGKNRIAVFTDPDCPFCKRLEQDVISKLNNVTVYYFLYPLNIHAKAKLHSEKILCAENPDKAYYLWMTAKNPVLPKNYKCNNAKRLKVMMEVGKQIVDIDSTPTIILPNGQVVPGLIPADYLTKLISDAARSLHQSPESSISANSSIKKSRHAK